MIYTVGQVPDSNLYTRSSFTDFLEWEKNQSEYQLDIETTMTDWWCDKELITMQFGSTEENTQWFLHWLSLNSSEKEQMKQILEDRSKKKLIHNGMFEYVVLLFHGIMIENIYDTMLAEQVIFGGQMPESGESLYSLAALMMRYFSIDMSKELQTSFSHEPITEEQVMYAVGDVQPLAALRKQQLEQLREKELEKVFELECEALLAYGDMTYNGMELNSQAWLKNLEHVEPLIEQSLKDLEAAVISDPVLYQKALELEYISEQDRLVLNWNSSQQKKQVLSWAAPELEMCTKAYLQKFLKSNTISREVDDFLFAVVDRDYGLMNEYITANYREELITYDFLIPAGKLVINWNSVTQVLPLIQAVEHKLKAMDADSMAKTTHPIISMITDYKDTLKLKTTYGESFLEKYLEPDGKIRTRFNQVVSTGRVSSSKPNMQNIPAKETVGNRYRNAFVCSPGWKYVDSDYVSQELVIIAYLSKDPVWDEALRKNQDLHSVCSELIFKNKWKEGAQEDCAYYARDGKSYAKQKCSCRKHKSMRNQIKPINFGLAYGMSEFKLAGDQKISLQEARNLISEYFSTFPKISSLLNYLGRFGVEKGYIQTIWPYFRKRYFPEWHSVPKWKIDAHRQKIEYDPTLGSIERASKNMPIQGTAADITKYSSVLIRKFINENGLRDKIKFVVQVHDQNTTICTEDIAEWWKEEMTKLMEKAALYIIPNGLLKADTNISDVWTK